MTLGFGSSTKRERSCRFCGAATHPEALSQLKVPYFSQPSYEVCVGCRTDYESSGWRLEPFAPRVDLVGHYLWPEPLLADEDAAEGDLRAGFESYREARARIVRLSLEEEPIRAKLAAAPAHRPLRQLWLRDSELATLAFGVDRELMGLLTSAWEAFDEYLPSYTFTTPLHARVAVVLAMLTLEMGERAPRAYGPRKKGPAAWLMALSDQARQQPALRDPRTPLIRALLYREEDNVGGLDKELRVAQGWLDAQESPEAWSDVSFAIHYDRHLRASDERRWPDAREHLKACSTLRPDAAGVFLRLARAYLSCAQPQVAREVLAAKLGSSRVTDAGVRDSVARLLGELRPQLESRRTAHPDEPLRILYGACLHGLGETDAAWRALGGKALLEDLDWDDADPELGERLHLAGLIAYEREDLESAIRLLMGASDASTGKATARVQHDLLCMIAYRLRELLDDLEAATRDPEGLSEALAPGLTAIHALIRQHGPTLLAATTEYERAVFARFLGRELGDWFRALVTPPSISDREDVGVTDVRLRIDLAYLALSKRRLPDALRQDKAARQVTGHGVPIHLLLTYLDLVRRGGPPAQAWASREWATLPARRAPIEVGLLIVPDEAFAERDVDALVGLFTDPGRGQTVGRGSLRSLRDRCQLIVPKDAPMSELVRDPAVRAYVRALFDACPAFPFVLNMSTERDQFRLFFGCLASPDALLEEAPFLNAVDASVVDPVRRALDAIRDVAQEAGVDPDVACASILSHYPPGWKP
jgi:hypothetical protein